METFSLDNILNREIELEETFWTHDQSTNTTIQTFTFPRDMLNVFIKEKMRGFKYFKSDIRLTFRMNSNALNLGTIMIAVNPDHLYDPVWDNVADCYDLSGYPHLIMSASTNDTCSIDLPFVFQNRFLDMASDPWETQIGQVKIKVLNALRSVNPANLQQAEIVTTAQFINPTLVLPLPVKVSSHASEAELKAQNFSISNTLNNMSMLTSSIQHPSLKPYTDGFKQLAHIASIWI